jgi:hypothetical protein
LFFVWVINCPSPVDCRKLRDWARAELTPNTTFVDEVRAFPDGKEVLREVSHRLGDHFDSIQEWPTAEQQSTSFRLLFHRRLDAGRVWKDLMARALQQVRDRAAHTTTTLEYRGDQPPEPLATGT